ncbi:MAG: glycosyltransferase family 2 protein [Sphingobium sp.]
MTALTQIADSPILGQAVFRVRPSPPPAAWPTLQSPAPQPLQLAVVIPVINEAGNIGLLIDALSAALDGLCWEVIFVDDGSIDGTIALIDGLALRHRHIRALKRIGRTGLASAVLEGAMSTSAPVVAVMDGDMQHDETQLPSMYRRIAGGDADLVVASRYAHGGSTDGFDARRLQGSLLVTRLSNRLLRTHCSDPMSGFFVVRREVLAELCPRLSAIGFKILLDILVTGRHRLRVVEQPFRFRTRLSGESKMSLKILADLMTLCVDKTVGRMLPTRLVLFLAVGSLGLVVHLLVLRGLLGWTGDFRLAQTAAVLTAIAFNFTLNNIVTYASQRLRGWRIVKGLLSFYLVCGTGALANIGIATLMFGGHRSWWVAGIAGAVTGAVWNYAASSLLTWKTR